MNEVIRSVGKIRTNYVRGAIKEREMRGRGPRPVFYYQEAFDRWIVAHDTEVKRASAVDALTEAADAYLRESYDVPRVSDWLRARAAAYLREETE